MFGYSRIIRASRLQKDGMLLVVKYARLAVPPEQIVLCKADMAASRLTLFTKAWAVLWPPKSKTFFGDRVVLGKSSRRSNLQ